MRIEAIQADHYRVPLPVALSDSTHGTIESFELLGAGGAAVHALIARDLAPLLVGRDAEHIEALWQTMSYLEAHGSGLDRFIAEPLRIEGGCALAPDRPGHGIELDWTSLESVRSR
jgi:L-alanine-DL-glutamate epimerase-like enolase superfamily enzyme